MRKISDFFITIFTLLRLFIFMWIMMFIISIPALPFLLGKSVNLTCNRVEINYVNCQQEHIHFYGLWSEPITPPLRVTSAVIKKYEIEEENSTSTGYKLYLNTKDESRELYDYIRESNKALNDQQRINDLILGHGDSFLNIKISKNLWGEIGLIPLGFFYVTLGFVGVWFLIFIINFVREKIAR